MANAPTVTDDVTKGFYIGSTWTDNQTGRMYQASDVTTGAAVWNLLAITTDPTGFFIGTTGFQWSDHFLFGEACIDGSVGWLAGNASVQDSEQNHPGVWGINTSVASDGFGHLSLDSNPFLLGGGTWFLSQLIKIPTLSDGTDRFTVRIGFQELNDDDSDNGIYFRYTHDVNSGKWEGVCRVGASETAIDLGIAATTAFTALRIQVNSDATNIDFYIDGDLVGSITTDIPVGVPLDYILSIVKSLGTTSRRLDIDFFTIRSTFTTPVII